MFKKILIANRGEIACRIMKTAKKLGISTVAVYSEADKNALHVQMADEAVSIGPASSKLSYLVIDNIIAAARQSSAEAIHPGYGFLSENSLFAEAVEAAGLNFIGPPASCIAQMGDKITSKNFAAECGVPIVPGMNGIISTVEDALRISDDIGYPVMIKASAGGGGKGMRIAWSEQEVRQGFALAASEAQASFGDDRIFIEKFIENPRHIEIQVLGDKHGAIIHLGERECSIQRRNQKIIEEAPSMFLDQEMRARMGAQAVALAKAMNYQSAGTVEFIVDQNRQFYFLEMNTRLQVEHPVTELVTGVDLVELMIRIAAGEKLPLSQDDVVLSGSAIECRICTEDPSRDFLPSTGRLKRFQPPKERKTEGIILRHDCGVYEGDEMTLHYDPMISKLIVHAPDRKQATDEMIAALDEFYCDGVQANILFLSELLQQPEWQKGDISTGFIAQRYPDGFDPLKRVERFLEVFLGAAVCLDFSEQKRKKSQLCQGAYKRIIEVNGHFYPVIVQSQKREHFHVDLLRDDGLILKSFDIVSEKRNGYLSWRGQVSGKSVCVQRHKHDQGLRLSYHGCKANIKFYSERQMELLQRLPEKRAVDFSHYVLCPMPGLLLSLTVTKGQSVKTGDVLCVVEAMKMQNVIRSERDGVIAQINVGEGDVLSVDAVIMEFE